MIKEKFKANTGLTLIEILIGVAITALMMGAMFASYSVVNNSYNQVTDKAKVSRSSRDIVGMIIRDIRLAGFKYYYGANDEGIEQFHDLEHISGSESDRTVNDSHDPIKLFKDTLGSFFKKDASISIKWSNFVILKSYSLIQLKIKKTQLKWEKINQLLHILIIILYVK